MAPRSRNGAMGADGARQVADFYQSIGWSNGPPRNVDELHAYYAAQPNIKKPPGFEGPAPQRVWNDASNTTASDGDEEMEDEYFERQAQIAAYQKAKDAINLTTSGNGSDNASITFSDPKRTAFGDVRDQMIADHHEKYPVTGPVLADDVPVYCICNGTDDGRQMIECSNGERFCLKHWYHIECINMTKFNVPQGDWFCKACKKDKIGKLRNHTNLGLPRDTKTIQNPNKKQTKTRSKRGPGLALKVDTSSLTGVMSAGTPLSMSNPSPTKLKPWTADLDKTFINEIAENYNLNSLEDAKSALLTGTPAATPSPVKKCKWTKEEEDHLIAVVRECVNTGLSGEPLWMAVIPMLLARGVNRSVAGAKMLWCRELRERTKIDERRRKDAAYLRTAIQDGQKRPRARGKKVRGRQTKVAEAANKEEQEMQDAILLSMATEKLQVHKRSKSI